MKVFCASLALLSCLVAAEEPVTKVVNLLKDLKSKIEADGTTEQEAYDKLACWCQKTTGRSAATINSVRADIEALGSNVLALKGKITTLEGEIAQLIKDIKENEEMQQQLTSARQKENAAYMAEKAEQSQALAALEKAITVLTGATIKSGAALLQTSTVSTALSDALSATSRASSHVHFSARQITALNELTRSQASGSYAPQSATIQGILTDMYTTFSADLETDTKDEAKAQKAFEELMDAKAAQLALAQKTLEKKEAEKTEAELMGADAMQAYEDNTEKLKSETELFEATKASCDSKTAEWSTRSDLRKAELAGLEKAITILSTDEARDLFKKAIKPGVATPTTFLQLDDSTSNAVAKAFATLQTHAREAGSPRLAALSATLKLGRGKQKKVGHFTAVIQAIDTMISTIMTQKEDDLKMVDKCKKDLQENSLETQELNWKIEKNTAKIGKLEKEIEDDTAEKTAIETDIGSEEKKLEDLKTERENENAAFLAAKDDDEKAIGLLTQAKDALTEYYEKNGVKVSLAQIKQEPEPEFKLSDKGEYKVASGGIVKLLDMVISDLQNEIKEASQAEEAAQKDYEAIKAAAETNIQNMKDRVTNLEGSIAKAKEAKEDKEGEKTANEGLLKTEETELTNMKPYCDAMISGQADRRTKMETELEGLRQAKEYLAGAMPNLGVLAQTSSKATKSIQQVAKGTSQGFDDDAFPRITFQAVSFLQRH